MDKLPAMGSHLPPLRLRVGSGRWVEVRSVGGSPESVPSAARTATAVPAAPPTLAPAPSAHGSADARGRSLGYKPVIALIEAVPSGADDLVAAAIMALESLDYRVAIFSLDGMNRVASRLGCMARSPSWCWNHSAPDLLVPHGRHILIPGPSAEPEVQGEAVQAAVGRAYDATDATLIDLGCRWEPRIFRPALFLATHIWILTRSGQWTGAEMRLEQAEFSGWTDMRRVRVVVIGGSPTGSVRLAGPVAGTLLEPGGQAAREFVLRELGRA